MVGGLFGFYSRSSSAAAVGLINEPEADISRVRAGIAPTGLTELLCVCPCRCEQLLAVMAHMSGLSVQDVSDSSITLGLDIAVPTSRQEPSSSKHWPAGCSQAYACRKPLPHPKHDSCMRCLAANNLVRGSLKHVCCVCPASVPPCCAQGLCVRSGTC
jgi:hypothetical protein